MNTNISEESGHATFRNVQTPTILQGVMRQKNNINIHCCEYLKLFVLLRYIVWGFVQ